MKHVTHGVVLLATLLPLACGELEAPPIPSGGLDDRRVDAQDDPPPEDGGLGNPQAPRRPQLGAVPTRYGHDTLMLRGQTDGNAAVVVEGGRAPVATDADTAGSFCIDVPLVRGATNRLSVTAQNEHGEVSQAVVFEVVQDPSMASPVPPEKPLVELARDLTFYSDVEPKQGALTALTDGDESTSALMPESMIWVQIAPSYALEKLEIVFAPAGEAGNYEYAVEYTIFASDAPAPSLPPSEGAAGWTTVQEITPDTAGVADGGSDVVELATPLPARYVAFWLLENDKYDWSENIRVHEVRVFGRSTEVGEPVDAAAPTCASP